MALIAVASIAGVALLLLVAAQLILPSIAADRLRHELSAHGRVQSVGVKAFPAVKLLWGEADTVTVWMSSLHAAVTQSGALIARGHETTRLDVRIASATVGPLALHDVRLTSIDGRLHGQASASDSELAAALPLGLKFEPIASGNGELLLRGTASVLGVGVSANALLSAQDGRLVIAPAGIPFGGLAQLTVFDDPRVAITGVGASSYAGGFTFTADGVLRG